jgi:2-dehydro-3-deoxygluconokinase
MAKAISSDFDFDEIFRDKTWLHFSGTLPALSTESKGLTETALIKAKEHGLTVSCDLNYRKKLWSQKEAREVMPGLLKYVDVLIGNEEDATNVLGMSPEGVNVSDYDYPLNPYHDLAKAIHERFGMKYVAITFRKNFNADINKWSAGLFDGKEFIVSREYTMNVVDRVGGGDSFSGALIYALQSNFRPVKAIEFAVAASCLKHSIPGDFNLVSKEEVFNLMSGDASGRIQR